MQLGNLSDAIRSVGVSDNTGNNTPGKDDVVVNLMQHHSDEIIPVWRWVTGNAIVPYRTSVHRNQDIILAIATLIAVNIFSADSLCRSHRQDGIKLVGHADKISSTTACKQIGIAKVCKGDPDLDSDLGNPGRLNDFLASENDTTNLQTSGRIMNMKLESGAIALWGEDSCPGCGFIELEIGCDRFSGVAIKGDLTFG